MSSDDGDYGGVGGATSELYGSHADSIVGFGYPGEDARGDGADVTSAWRPAPSLAHDQYQDNSRSSSPRPISYDTDHEIRGIDMGQVIADMSASYDEDERGSRSATSAGIGDIDMSQVVASMPLGKDASKKTKRGSLAATQSNSRRVVHTVEGGGGRGSTASIQRTSSQRGSTVGGTSPAARRVTSLVPNIHGGIAPHGQYDQYTLHLARAHVLARFNESELSRTLVDRLDDGELVLWVEEHNRSTRPPDRWRRKLVFMCLAIICCIALPMLAITILSPDDWLTSSFVGGGALLLVVGLIVHYSPKGGGLYAMTNKGFIRVDRHWDWCFGLRTRTVRVNYVSLAESLSTQYPTPKRYNGLLLIPGKVHILSHGEEWGRGPGRVMFLHPCGNRAGRHDPGWAFTRWEGFDYVNEISDIVTLLHGVDESGIGGDVNDTRSSAMNAPTIAARYRSRAGDTLSPRHMKDPVSKRLVCGLATLVVICAVMAVVGVIVGTSSDIVGGAFLGGAALGSCILAWLQFQGYRFERKYIMSALRRGCFKSFDVPYVVGHGDGVRNNLQSLAVRPSHRPRIPMPADVETDPVAHIVVENCCTFKETTLL